jgi:hypothetical protein
MLKNCRSNMAESGQNARSSNHKKLIAALLFHLP